MDQLVQQGEEKIDVAVYETAQEGSKFVANRIVDTINANDLESKPTVLGLATGSSPTLVYKLLIEAYTSGRVSFKNVITFNLDEYYPMKPDALQSYVRFMNEHLFDHIDINGKNVHVPDGTILEAEVANYCLQYDKKIEEAGGLQIQLLGIGRTGHIGFNEPGSKASSKTRMIHLDKVTRLDAASDFFGEEFVPDRAVTMGVGTILKAKEIYLMAWGEGKAPIVKRSVEGDVTTSIPATYLQNHDRVTFVLDQAASAFLRRSVTPWLVSDCIWSDKLIHKAVIWLAEKMKKPILKLTNEDYNENGMAELLASQGPAEDINVKIFKKLQRTITGWPGGKPDVDDRSRPERSSPFPKRVLIFSPHPDDDIISMGGTLLRLVQQGHDVHIAYQTSGNIAVFDDDAVRFVDFAVDFNRLFVNNDKAGGSVFEEIRSFINNKQPGEVDIPQIQVIKGLIRRGEAKATCRYCGVKDENVHFLDMPFYETGKVKKKPLGDDDIMIVESLISKIRPHQIFAAGDLSDPHGTHRVCLSAIYKSIKNLRQEPWISELYVWLYRGAWQEWDIHEIEMAVPIGPKELMQKRRGIFKHQSQKDKAMFPGADSREFWQRAEDRNRATARSFDALGLPEYEAIEAFVKWKLEDE